MSVAVPAYPRAAPAEAGLAGPLRRVRLPGTGSRILAATDGWVWLFAVRAGRGWFAKDREPALSRGRVLCDRVREHYGCDGFLTTDELPRYGLGRRDRAALFGVYPGADKDRDVLVLLAHDERRLAEDIRADIAAALYAGFAPA
ncbi:MAG TPA: hypothetical protein VGH99_16425 [Pseudonocardia sp.]|jgi:Glu-tRNA(Gln) amidotransferase subunit E-like FAD-binding protein